MENKDKDKYKNIYFEKHVYSKFGKLNNDNEYLFYPLNNLIFFRYSFQELFLDNNTKYKTFNYSMYNKNITITYKI